MTHVHGYDVRLDESFPRRNGHNQRRRGPPMWPIVAFWLFVLGAIIGWVVLLVWLWHRLFG